MSVCAALSKVGRAVGQRATMVLAREEVETMGRGGGVVATRMRKGGGGGGWRRRGKAQDPTRVF